MTMLQPLKLSIASQLQQKSDLCRIKQEGLLVAFQMQSLAAETDILPVQVLRHGSVQ